MSLLHKTTCLLGIAVLFGLGLVLATPCQAAFVSTMDLESEKGSPKQSLVNNVPSRDLADKIMALGYSKDEAAIEAREINRRSVRGDRMLVADRPERVAGK